MEFGLLILRLVVGLTLAAHGTQKLFGWFGGYGLSGTGGFMEQLGFRPGRRAAFLAGFTEFSGGLLLALGAATPLAATLILAVMLVAAVSVHAPKGFWNHAGGYEFLLVLGTVALTFAITGPGRLSVDALLGLDWRGPAWGAVSLVAGLASGTVQLLTRHREPVAEAAAA